MRLSPPVIATSVSIVADEAIDAGVGLVDTDRVVAVAAPAEAASTAGRAQGRSRTGRRQSSRMLRWQRMGRCPRSLSRVVPERATSPRKAAE